MKTNNLFLSAVIFVLFSGYAGAQDKKNNLAAAAKPDSVHALHEVIIKENRIQMPFTAQNRNIQIIGREQIKSFSGKSVGELLSYAAGVDVRQRGPEGIQTDVSIDGGIFDQTLVLINGVKVSDPQTGHHIMNLPVPLSAIDHIEILRGAAARVYGINALAGAINIVTLNPGKIDYSVNLHSGTSFKKDEAENRAYVSTGIDSRVNFAEKNSSHLVAVGLGKGSGYRYNTAFDQYKAFYQGRFTTGKTDQLDVTAGYIYNSFGANAFYAAPGDVESEETVNTGMASVGYKTQVRPGWTFFPRASIRLNKDNYLYIRQTPDKYRNKHKTGVYNLELNNTIETGAGTIGLGLEGRIERIRSTNIKDHQRSNMGVFGEYKTALADRLLVTAGLYANYNTDYGWQLFPGFDAGYEFLENWKVYVNAGASQRMPTYTDLYSTAPNVGNAGLLAETAKYAESGVKYNDERFSFNTSYFFRRTSNFIDWVKDNAGDKTWEAGNFGQRDIQGYTMNGNYRISSKPSAVRLKQAGLSYTYLNPNISNSIIEGKISKYAVESLRHQMAATADLQFFNNLSLTAGARYCKRINYKDYTLIDARLSYTSRAFKIYADLSNLLDVTYIEAGAVRMPGSWYTLGIELFKFR